MRACNQIVRESFANLHSSEPELNPNCAYAGGSANANFLQRQLDGLRKDIAYAKAAYKKTLQRRIDSESLFGTKRKAGLEELAEIDSDMLKHVGALDASRAKTRELESNAKELESEIEAGKQEYTSAIEAGKQEYASKTEAGKQEYKRKLAKLESDHAHMVADLKEELRVGGWLVLDPGV